MPRWTRVVYLPKQDALLGLLDQDHVYALDLATAVWRRLDVELPQGSYGTECSKSKNEDAESLPSARQPSNRDLASASVDVTSMRPRQVVA